MRRACGVRQNVARFLDAYDEWVYSTASDSGSAMLTWNLEIVGHVDSRSRSGVSGERSACERRKRKSCRKAFVLINELAMLRAQKTRVRFRIVLASCWVLWTGLTKSSLVRLRGVSELVLFVACRKGSKVMPETRRVPEACRGNRILYR